MSVAIVWGGSAAGVMLLGLLLFNLKYRQFGLWPAVSPDSWQARTFWLLFRTTNLSALCLAAVGWQPGTFSDPARLASAVAAASLGFVYLRSCLTLGSRNLYCGMQGLNRRGVYRLSRNPQYTTAIAAYGLLVIASSAEGLLLLAIILTGIYWLMARSEEPWLSDTYGAEYRDYVAEVPRFLGIRSLIGFLAQHASSQRRQP